MGETLAPAGVALLEELGLTQAFARDAHRASHATYSAWGVRLLAQSNAIANVGGAGYVLDRSAFDRMLHDARLASGATVISACVLAGGRDEAGWRIALGGGARVHARFAIDCSGRAAVLARRLARARRVDRLVAAYAAYRQRADEIDPTPATLIEAIDGGWWYATLLPDRRMSVAFFTDAHAMPRGMTHDLRTWNDALSATQFVQRWLESAAYERDGPVRIASAATTWLEPAAGADWAAAGDAAAAFDPLSSHGLTTALWSGRRAALVARAALAGDMEQVRDYAHAVQGAVASMLQGRRTIYACERRFEGSPFWESRRAGDGVAR
jgi:flavin-dependent dehydrogenase